MEEEYIERTSGDFTQIIKGDYYIGVDFGFEKDFSTETIIRKKKDGIPEILSTNIIGRASSFDTKEKRENYLKKHRV